MDIQWVILARAWRVNEDGTMDIAKIFDRVGSNAPEYRATFVVLAKIQAEPTEVGKDLILTLQLKDKSGTLIESKDCSYNIPDIRIWAKSTPFVSFDIEDYPFKKVGEYSFDIVIDGQVKNREWVIIKDRKEMQNA